MSLTQGGLRLEWQQEVNSTIIISVMTIVMTLMTVWVMEVVTVMAMLLMQNLMVVMGQHWKSQW